MRFAAKKRRGECLSKAYIDSGTHLHWRCRHGHEWQATPNKIQQGKWCPRCAGKGKTISDMQQAASLRDGMCLSKTYKGMFVKLLWQCGKGHKFKTMPNQVLNHGTWCPECYLESKGLTPAECRRQLREMKRLARSKGGRCLSTEYKNNQTHLQWRCKNGHEWMAAPSHTKHSGTWCATCAAGVSERICRAVIERIFGTAFPKKKPAWLLSKRQTRMELDGYAEELRVAFEYQGIQHFIKNKRFHSGSATLGRRMSDDKWKAMLCRRHRVLLLQIPHTVPHGGFEDYIRTLAKTCTSAKQANSILNRTTAGKIDLSKLNAYSPANILEMRQIALARDGSCLSKAYVNNMEKLRWRCKQGHVWNASPVSIKTGKWCPDCAGNRRLTLADMQTLARGRNGECLATEYCGSKAKLSWRCSKGHQWNAKPDNIKMGKWCPYCSNRPPVTIDDVRALAKARGGQCLSTWYVNAHGKLRLICAKGHEWLTNQNMLQQGRWCPVCSRSRTSVAHVFRSGGKKSRADRRNNS